MSIRVSASSLATIEQCPRNYQLKYLLGVEEPFSERGLLGSAIHDTIKMVYDEENFERENVIDTYHNLRGVGEYATVSDDVWQEGFPILQRWFTGVTKRGWLVKPILCEDRFEFEIAPGITVSGKIDLVIAVKGKIYIIDWKSARGKPSEARLKKDPQLMIYSVACKAVHSLDGMPLLYYIRSDAVFGFTFEIHQYRALVGRMLAMKDTIENENFVATKNDYCQYCPEYEICETRKIRRRVKS
jgi:CRISPR/Cas system-associated exonuclease Cas4 (RecB family)